MAKYETKLAKLKDLLQTGDDFGEIMQYFLDHLGDHQDFINMGKRAKNKLVQEALLYVGKKLFQTDVKVTNVLLTEVKKAKFFHGACFIQGCFANLIYFEDIDVGMVAVLRSPHSSYVEYIRFTCYKVDVDKDAFFQSGNRTIN